MLKKINYLSQLFFHYNNWILVWWHAVRKGKSTLLCLHLRNGINIYGAKTSQLLSICEEIFFRKVYEYKTVKVEPGDIVVDVGANIGIFALAAIKLGAKKIYALEPDKMNQRLLLTNSRENHFKSKIAVLPFAVSNIVGKLNLHLGEADGGYILMDNEKKAKLTKQLSTIKTVKTVTLPFVTNLLKIENIDFLKIDCEGSEGIIIDSIPPKWWRKVKKLALEYHDNVSTLNHNEIKNRLETVGFIVHVNEEKDSPFGYIHAWRS